MTRTAPARGGVTLIELLVVLAILGTMAALAALAFGTRSEAASRPVGIADARRRAVDTRRPVSIALDSGDVLVMPDGRVIGASRDSVDSTTGRRHAAR